MAELHEVSDVSGSERVYRHLRREIIEGRYGPGERIVESRVASSLAMSRTPVREAVRRLETEGLIISTHNRGAQVRPLTESDVADLYEARARLEGFMSELAAQRAEPDDVAAIHDAADEFDRVVEEVDHGSVEGLRAILRANDRFHAALVRAGRADQVFRILATAVDMPLVFTAFKLYSHDELRRSSMFHRLIAEAVETRQPERAGRLMTEHVLQGRDAHMRRFREPEVEPASA
ncbi:GntR family transcriptional regulator [Ilumatobacter nonamiensis]|uniref:GntR family transcriptional regulator n=1 Tax=Ilumatobacter nonamiensis TaxID=467093 RepID=UPI0003484B19|nr:GntR family transcriptional regulator [Ilumatobacter nonamiensis]